MFEKGLNLIRRYSTNKTKLPLEKVTNVAVNNIANTNISNFPKFDLSEKRTAASKNNKTEVPVAAPIVFCIYSKLPQFLLLQYHLRS